MTNGLDDTVRRVSTDLARQAEEWLEKRRHELGLTVEEFVARYELVRLASHTITKDHSLVFDETLHLKRKP